ncbi:MAG: hypothetical protein FWF10_08430 [Clostridiales bacterium]|nr:hypothetical protein [Clostridiales bacterium]
MKRILPILLTFLLLLCVFPTASADVVWSQENDFFEQHKEDCVLVGRYFYLPNADRIVLKTEPGSNTNVELTGYETKYLSTNEIWVNYVYDHNGTPWGYIDYYSHYMSLSGWVSLEDALLVYDGIAFIKEHADSFYEYPGGYQAIKEKLHYAKTIVTWTFPGSGETERWTIDNGNELYDELSVDFHVLDAYCDEAGREWLRAITFYGAPFWICLSDPQNKKIPASHPPPQAWSVAELAGDYIYDIKLGFDGNIARYFSPNNPAGFVSAKESPGSDHEVFTLENGAYCHVWATFYFKETLWGCIENEDNRFLYGWVPMDQMHAEYDSTVFKEEFRDSITYKKEAELSLDCLIEADNLVLWAWPGSGLIVDIAYGEGIGSKLFLYRVETYVDAEGREWVYDSLFYTGKGHVYDVWICISDPTNEDISIPGLERKLLEYESPPTKENKPLSPLALAIILVSGAVLGSAVLILIFWKPKKRESTPELREE